MTAGEIDSLTLTMVGITISGMSSKANAYGNVDTYGAENEVASHRHSPDNHRSHDLVATQAQALLKALGDLVDAYTRFTDDFELEVEGIRGYALGYLDELWASRWTLHRGSSKRGKATQEAAEDYKALEASLEYAFQELFKLYKNRAKHSRPRAPAEVANNQFISQMNQARINLEERRRRAIRHHENMKEFLKIAELFQTEMEAFGKTDQAPEEAEMEPAEE